MSNLKTRKNYLNKEISHFEYYSQFVTGATINYVLATLNKEDIFKAFKNGDKHLNEIKIPFNNMGSGGNWWWDTVPINTKLVKQLGENLSPSTYTCVGKAAAKMIVRKKLEKLNLWDNIK